MATKLRRDRITTGAAYILCMKALGLTKGRGDGTYGAGLKLNRGQMASFLARLWRDVLGHACPEGPAAPFSDIVGSVHQEDIECVYALGITKGTTATTFSPWTRLTATQISLFLLRTYKRDGNICAAAGSEIDEAIKCLLALRVVPTDSEAKGSTPVIRAQMAVYLTGLWHNMTDRGLPPTPPRRPGSSPGAGVSVTMARANWSTGYLQAAIYAALLAELGYEVSDPADLELAPSNAFVAMANGEFDFWVNSWFPNHNQFLAGEMPDGSLVRDHLTTLGREMARAGVQGLITNKAFADANGLTTLDAMLSDPDVFAVYEAADMSPGDGILQIYGCPEGWGCRANINAWIENAGWDNIEQFDIGGYDAMIADAIARDAAGEPYMVYTWAPSHYVSDLRPGDNAVWVSIHQNPSVSPTQLEGATSIGDQCTTDPCLLGWDAADIRVTANSDFLAANPAAARLFELVTISPVDVALQNVRIAGGENTEDDVKGHAAEWIAINRELVDSWLQAARLAG